VDAISFTGVHRCRAVSAKPPRAPSSAWRSRLGGKSPNIILEDAELEPAIRDGVAKCFLNSGQTCSALTRMLVPRSRLAEAEQIAAAVAEYFSGRPL